MITEQVRQIIVDLLGVDESKVTPDARLIEDLNADSLDAVELAMSLEEHFKIQVADEEVERMSTVAEIAETIKLRRPDLEL
ncbi:MAG TPA: acyl carrier protein [Clostridiaceae bacterium]|nr:acyl carrier protein [Clostridiaceae bacterium]